MPNQTILIKPSSGNCNMNCKYCFYYDVMEHRGVKNYGFMSECTMENIVKKALEYADNMVGFAFQGGEPTLIGLEFYEKFVELVTKYNSKKIRTDFFIQTNGISINDAWAIFLKKNHFLVGISMDGPKEIHDQNRKDKTGKDTFNRVLKTVQLFNKYKVEYNVLCVVSKGIAKHPTKVYEFFKKNNIQFMQFIPCLDEFDKVGKNKYSLLPQDYGNFLCQLFDLWYQDIVKGNIVSIRMFDNIVQMLMGYPPESCDMHGRCSVNPVIESDGSVYPCDFYVLDEWRLGNINEHSFHELKNNRIGKEFVDKSITKPEECLQCKFLNICRTGCKRHAVLGENMENKNYFCDSYKMFYVHTLNRFIEIARKFNP